MNNVIGGANDYQLSGQSFYSSFDGGKNWYSNILPLPTTPTGEPFTGSDPAIVFDRAGIAYNAEIYFSSLRDDNGVFVHRSINGGRTWTRPCVADPGTNPNDDQATCGRLKPNDGVVIYQPDDNDEADGSVAFNDKEYIAAGPRPAGVSPKCFAPETRRVVACAAGTVGVDRLYVSWTKFEATAPFDSRIFISYSDDQARSWSPTKAISGAAPFCTGSEVASNPRLCNFNQCSVPTVHPRTGALYVAWENFNTPDENQYLMVRSTNGGQTFTSPRFVGSVFDVNYPRVGNDPASGRNRPDCEERGGSPGRRVLSNSCFRVNAYGNIVVDKRGGAFSDDVYVVISDNREGTPRKSNTNIYLFKSTNGDNNWTLPTRVNNDTSSLTGNHNDPNNAGVQGNDQWFPWVDINASGDLNVVFYDRRLDRNSTRHEWPGLSRQFPGNYLTWLWGAQCRVGSGTTQQTGQSGGPCVVSTALQPQPTAPVNPATAVPPARGRPGSRSGTSPSRTCRPTWTTPSVTACLSGTTTTSR